jgi:hypothetical protein
MQRQIISAYLSHTGEIVAIANSSYFVLKTRLEESKSNKVIKKINSIRMIETEHWKEMK